MAKNFQVKIQQEAIDELDELYRFIFTDSPRRARQFLKKLQNKILSLKVFPRRGSRAMLLEDSESVNEIRFLEYQGYLLFYTIDDKAVTVLHIAGPGQNWVEFFTRR